MENIIKAENTEINKAQFNEHSDISYWEKEYDISPEDLKNKEQLVGIYDKIVKSYLEKTN
jgi:hypothetical protein